MFDQVCLLKCYSSGLTFAYVPSSFGVFGWVVLVILALATVYLLLYVGFRVSCWIKAIYLQFVFGSSTKCPRLWFYFTQCQNGKSDKSQMKRSFVMKQNTIFLYCSVSVVCKSRKETPQKLT